MKLSCLPVSIYDDLTAGRKTLFDWLDFAAALGLDGADMSIVHLQRCSPDEQQALRRHAEALGLTIAMIVTYTDFTHPDAQERTRQVDGLRQAIDLALQLGVSFLRITAGQAHVGISRSEGITWAVEGLTACVSVAQQAGITLVYENHTIGYAWTHYDFSQPADIFQEIVAATDKQTLGLLFDTANNLALNDDPLAVLNAVKHRVAVLHASDIRRAGAFEPVVLGTGVAPIEAAFRIMQAIGFDGWVSVEEASKTGDMGFQKAIAYADQAWVQAGGTLRIRT